MMKRVTKLTAFLLALILVFGCSMSAFASSADEAVTEPAAETAAGTTEPEEQAEEAAGDEQSAAPEQAAEEATETEEASAVESTEVNETLAAATYADEANVTIQAGGESGTISGVSIGSNNIGNYGNLSWRVVDSSGSAVSGVTVTSTQSNSGSGGGPSSSSTYTLTITATEDVAEGTYYIQYGTKSGGSGGTQTTSWTSTTYTVAVTAYQWSSGVSGNITPGNGGGSDATVTKPTPGITKTATKAEEEDDYTYDLALTVSSDVGSSESKVAVDLLFIIDVSGSMDNTISGDTKRLAAAQSAVTGLVDTLEDNENLDMHYAVVTFSGSNKNSDSPWNDATEVQNWTDDAETVKTSVGSIKAEGGTNYEAGLRTGKEVLLNDSARTSAFKYVIFLSDGMPGYYYNSEGYTTGTGDTTNGANATADKHAQNMVKELVGINGFYTIYCGSDSGSNYLSNLTTAIWGASEAEGFEVGTQNAVASSAEALNDAFAEFGKNFTTISCTDATITDTLSDWVVPVTGATPYVVIKVTDEDGTVTTYSSKNGSIPEAEQGITASLNGKVLTLNFPDEYDLKEGYVYEVHLDIQPSDEAIQNGTDYTDTADAATGTHSGQQGYYSNTGATLTYTLTDDETENSLKYPMPVVQVRPTTTVTITKQVTGNMGDTSKQFSFTVKCTSAMGAATNGEYTLSEDGKTATFELSDDEFVTLNGVKKGSTITISEDSESYEMTAKVGETELTKDSDGNYTYTVPKDGTTLSITVTNEKEVTIDTGVLLDAIPYILILTVVAAGAALPLVRRKTGEK